MKIESFLDGDPTLHRVQLMDDSGRTLDIMPGPGGEGWVVSVGYGNRIVQEHLNGGSAIIKVKKAR